MAIILPATHSTFGDSSSTEGPIRKYVLAMFRSDADLGWMTQLRTTLGSTEVKYKHFRERRPNLRQNRDLWQQVEKGIRNATILVIDPSPVQTGVRDALIAEGAVEGRDFDEREVMRRCATALVASTPIAYLPGELLKVLEPHGFRALPQSFDFTPDGIKQRLGGSLRHAVVFSARAHAMFDTRRDSSMRATTDVFRSPLSRVILAELLSIRRVFDSENPVSVEILNDASFQMAQAIEGNPSHWSTATAPLVTEADSRTVDQLQAADLAAGWAREQLETGDIRAVAQLFDRVWLNGQLLAP